MEEFHLSQSRARIIVKEELRALGLDHVSSPFATITLKQGSVETNTTSDELVREARKLGYVDPFQSARDRSDSIFGGTHGIGSPNWQMKQAVEWAGYKKTLNGPGWFEPAVSTLVSDILYFRAEACAHSSGNTCVISLRHFRSYLGACISALEAFINRYVALARHNNFVSDEFTALLSSRVLAERFALWLKVFDTSKSNHSDFFAGPEWSQFREIQDFRNEIVHALNPVAGYEMREVQRFLNYVRLGVGGLMRRMRNLRGEPTLGFIERLSTAPLVHFRRITFRGDGNHLIEETL